MIVGATPTASQAADTAAADAMQSAGGLLSETPPASIVSTPDAATPAIPPAQSSDLKPVLPVSPQPTPIASRVSRPRPRLKTCQKATRPSRPPSKREMSRTSQRRSHRSETQSAGESCSANLRGGRRSQSTMQPAPASRCGRPRSMTIRQSPKPCKPPPGRLQLQRRHNLRPIG